MGVGYMQILLILYPFLQGTLSIPREWGGSWTPPSADTRGSAVLYVLLLGTAKLPSGASSALYVHNRNVLTFLTFFIFLMFSHSALFANNGDNQSLKFFHSVGKKLILNFICISLLLKLISFLYTSHIYNICELPIHVLTFSIKFFVFVI